jgi:predicted Ser/Thr protein kinase
MHEEPLHLLPMEMREDFLAELRSLHPDYPYPLEVEGDLCPVCRFMMREALGRHGEDLAAVLENEIAVKRLVLSEKDRIGIGTFQPKDEKNQDSTELTGDINYRKVAIYGSDSDPRAFNFDGELNIANRGIVEFIEILKLDVAFLYDLLTASQEHKIKSKKFAQTDIDEIVLGHTNDPEYRKLQANEYMEALRDRTIKIDIPYILRVSDEVRIYRRDFARVRGKHIAPHTLEMAATWAVLTRLEPPKRAGLTLMQKLKLYDGRLLPGWTEEAVRELMGEAKREGLEGISPRYIQDKISNVLVTSEEPCINPFMVINELEEGLKHHSLISDEKTRERYRALLQEVKAEYAEIVKNEVQRAIAADEEALNRLFHNYIDHVKAYVLGEKVKNPYTGAPEPPNELLMRSVEERIEIPESRFAGTHGVGRVVVVDVSPTEARGRGRGEAPGAPAGPGLPEPLREPPGGAPQGGGGRGKPQAPPPQAHPGHPGLPGPAHPPGPLAEGHPGDHPGGEPLLRPAGGNQDPQRGLGHLLAHEAPPPPPHPRGGPGVRRAPVGPPGRPRLQPLPPGLLPPPGGGGEVGQGALRPRVRGPAPGGKDPLRKAHRGG